MEQEAQAADVQVRRWLLAGKTSIAVVVQDRLVARRLRALLERAQCRYRTKRLDVRHIVGQHGVDALVGGGSGRFLLSGRA